MNTELFKIIAPIIGAALTGGGIVAYFQYRSSRPENVAKAKQINITAEVTIGEQWKIYAEKIEQNMVEMEARYEKKINDLTALVEQKDKEQKAVVLEKDKEITKLRKRVGDLEVELDKYKQLVEGKVETVKEHLHKSVDENIDQLKQ